MNKGYIPNILKVDTIRSLLERGDDIEVINFKPMTLIFDLLQKYQVWGKIKHTLGKSFWFLQC